MNASRLARCYLFVLLIAPSGWSEPNAIQPKDPGDLPALFGTVMGSDYNVAAFRSPLTQKTQWYNEGDSIGPYRIARIVHGEATLTDSTKREFVVAVVGARKETQTESPEPFSKVWINSKLNPMLLSPLQMPRNVTRAWGRMSKEERDAIARFYLDHGWRMTRIELVNGGGLSIEWENLFAAERDAMVRENRSRFADGLTAEQRALWDQLQLPQPIVRVGDTFTDQQKAEITRLRALSETFISSLNLEQKNKREAIYDFTTGKW